MMETKVNAYTRVLAARANDRNMGGYYLSRMIDDFVELHGDRRFGDDGAIVGGVGMLNGTPVTAIAMERGATVEERIERHFGCPTPEGFPRAEFMLEHGFIDMIEERQRLKYTIGKLLKIHSAKAI